MASLKELHAQDPETWSPQKLSDTYGISYEAVKRVLRSNYQGSAAGGLSGTPASYTLAAKNRSKNKSASMDVDGSAAPPSPDAADTATAPGKWATGATGSTGGTDRDTQQAYMAKWDKAKVNGRQASSVSRIQRAYDIKRLVEGTQDSRPAVSPRRQQSFSRREND